MAYNYTTLQAIIQKKYLSKLYDQIFTKNHYLWYLLKQNARTYNERKIVVPLEYAKATTVGFVARGGSMGLKDEELVTAAEFEPKMFYGNLMIYKEDELQNTSKESIEKLLQIKTNNLKMAMEESLADHIWTRGVSGSGNTEDFHTIDYLVNEDTSVDVGDILSSGTVPSWWLSKIIDLANDSFYSGADPTDESQLMDPASKVYLLKIFRRLVALAKYQLGEMPTVIVCPQYVADMYEAILEEKKLGSKMNEKAGTAGFTLLDFRGVAIAPDDDMVVNQTGDNDGRIYAFNMNHLYLYFNSGAKFTMEPFVKPANINARSATVLCYGNLGISNRRNQAAAIGIRSPQSYATAA